MQMAQQVVTAVAIQQSNSESSITIESCFGSLRFFGKSNDSFAPNSRQGKEERLPCGTSVRQNHHYQLVVSTLAFEPVWYIEEYFENILSFSKQPTSVVAHRTFLKARI